MQTFFGGLAIVSVILGSIAAWITHVVACIKAGAMLLLIIGIVVPPIGLIHGVMVWFGVSWAQ